MKNKRYNDSYDKSAGKGYNKSEKGGCYDTKSDAPLPASPQSVETKVADADARKEPQPVRTDGVGKPLFYGDAPKPQNTDITETVTIRVKWIWFLVLPVLAVVTLVFFVTSLSVMLVDGLSFPMFLGTVAFLLGGCFLFSILRQKIEIGPDGMRMCYLQHNRKLMKRTPIRWKDLKSVTPQGHVGGDGKLRTINCLEIELTDGTTEKVNVEMLGEDPRTIYNLIILYYNAYTNGATRKSVG